MKTLATALMCACIVLAAGGAAGQDATKKDDATTKDSMTKSMTMQECKDHMAMAKKEGTKKDDAMMKKDTMCADMMKKDSMKKDDATMKKEEPMKK